MRVRVCVCVSMCMCVCVFFTKRDALAYVFYTWLDVSVHVCFSHDEVVVVVFPV